MGLNPANISTLELAWTIPAFIAVLLSLATMIWIRQSILALQYSIARYPQTYRTWGPRWNFLILLGGCLLFFGFGWLGYVVIGIIAMLTPPSIAEVNQQASEYLAWILLAMEACHAIAQGLLTAALLSLAGRKLSIFKLRRMDMRRWFPLLLTAALLVVLLTPIPVLAEDGGSYALPADQNCDRVDRPDLNVGKTPVTFEATATDGCHTIHWTNTQGQDGASGRVSFMVNSKAMQVWEPGSTLPQPNGPGGWCAYQAAHEAQGFFVNLFKARDGTEVTVTYSCT